MIVTSGLNIATINPIRYRGYYYDNDLGLYYLQSRYYDATIGRFINADGYITTGQGILSHNMYAYCSNNPVMYSDPSGESALLGLFIAYVVVATGIVIAGAICAEEANNNRENQSNYKGIDQELKENYTVESATDACNDIVDKYSTDDAEVSVKLTDKGIHIENSYLVSSKYDRQKISEIWSRTNATNRSYDSLSAEWKFHNDLYNILPKSKWKTQAQHADLDYVRDRRFYVYYPSLLYEEIGWD